MVPMTVQTRSIQPLSAYPVKLANLISQLQATATLTPQSVKELVTQAQITSDDLMPWADFEHSVKDSYGRKMVFDGGHFEVMVMSWMPGDISAIHDHGGTQWGAVQCFGAAEHYIYELNGSVLTTREVAPYSPGMVRSVSHDLIHQMGNSSDRPFLSLHVYGNFAAMGNITGNARIFELLEGTIQYTDGGVFFSLPESDINRRHGSIQGDRITTCRHHKQMRDRLRRIVQQHPSFELTQRLNILEERLQN